MGTDQHVFSDDPEPHPTKAGAAFWRLTEGHIPVWAIIGALLPDLSNKSQVAADYQISLQAVDVALDFYRHHRAAIDAWLLLNHNA